MTKRLFVCAAAACVAAGGRANPEIELPPCGVLVGNAIYNYFDFFPTMYGWGFTTYSGQHATPLELVERTVKENQGNIIQFWPMKSDRPCRQAAWLALEDLGYSYPPPDWTNLRYLRTDEFPEFKKYEEERAGAGLLKAIAACETNGLYSMAIYMNGLHPDYARKLTDNPHYIGYDIGEIFSFTYDSAAATNAAAPRLDRLAKDLTEKIRKHIEQKRAEGYGLISCTSSNFFMDYEIAAGVDFTLFEDLTDEMNLISALSRGLARQHGRKVWGSHIANEYYDWIWWGTPHCDETLYSQMAMKYMAGAKVIISESGAWHCQTPAKGSPQGKAPVFPGTWRLNSDKTRPSDAEVAPKVREAMKYREELSENGAWSKAFRRQMSDFYDHVKKHGTPEGQPETTFAIAKGNYDLWCGAHDGVPKHSQVIAGLHRWAESHPEWFAGAPEDGWGIAHDVFWPCGQGIYGTRDLNRCMSGTPWGQVDVVSFAYDEITSDFLLRNYKALAFVGWNTCSEKQYRTLCEYVKGGGRLFISIPQLSTDVTRNAFAYTRDDLVRKGDFSELCGLKVLGRGDYFFWGRAPYGKRLPWVGEGRTAPESYGAYRGLLGKVEVSNKDAETVLYDNESGDTVLYRLPSGKGEVWFLNSWFYPGTYNYTHSVGAQAGDVGMTGEILRHLAKLSRGTVYITEKGSDDPGDECTFVNVSHFPSDGTIFLLNVDFAHPHTVDLHVAGKTTTVTLAPKEFRRMKR